MLWEFLSSNVEWNLITSLSNAYYGTKGMASTSTYPGLREGAVAWIDLSGTVWIFGGYGETENKTSGK